MMRVEKRSCVSYNRLADCSATNTANHFYEGPTPSGGLHEVRMGSGHCADGCEATWTRLKLSERRERRAGFSA